MLLIVCCSGAIVGVLVLSDSLWLSLPVLAVLLALHSSLQHEALHGHPLRSAIFNELLVSIPFGLYIPYQRFRDLHLQHHIDENLTDPHDDPESNYLEPAAWQSLSPGLQRAMVFNNTLAGRMLIGPAFSLYRLYRDDWAEAAAGNRAVMRAYAWHFGGLATLLLFLPQWSSLPLWAYALSAYACLSLLRIRTFLEHQAAPSVGPRTVVIEDRGFFSWLFLNNNFHLVHHMYPGAPWYTLPALYRARRAGFLARNESYVFKNYGQVFSRYLFKTKDPLPHPHLYSESNK